MLRLTVCVDFICTIQKTSGSIAPVWAKHVVHGRSEKKVSIYTIFDETREAHQTCSSKASVWLDALLIGLVCVWRRAVKMTQLLNGKLEESSSNGIRHCTKDAQPLLDCQCMHDWLISVDTFVVLHRNCRMHRCNYVRHNSPESKFLHGYY